MELSDPTDTVKKTAETLFPYDHTSMQQHEGE